MTTELEWHKHDGGTNPVREGERLVEVMFRNGDKCSCDHNDWHWGNGCEDATITHYRVTPPRAPPMSAEEVLVRAREAMVAACFGDCAESAARTRAGGIDSLSEIRAILAFHRDLSRPLAEVAPHTVEDADERAAYDLYAKTGGIYAFPDRMESETYRNTLAAYRAGKAAR